MSAQTVHCRWECEAARGSTSGSRTSETGGQISEKIFRRPFLGVSPKISPFPPKNSIYLFKISDDFFLVINLFVFYIWYFSMGGPNPQPTSIGGPNSLLFNKITLLPLLFLSRRGAKLHCQFRWGGRGRICPPWIRHCAQKRKNVGPQKICVSSPFLVVD